MADTTARPQWRHHLARGFAVLGAALLSACTGIVPRGPVEQAPPAPTRPQPTRPAPVTGGIPEDTQRHRVALLVPLTGPNGGVGRSIANATQLALLDSRSERVRITTYDTATGAAAAAQRAIAEGNRLILGPLLADDVRAVAPIARGAKVPVISYSNDVSVAGNGAYLLGYTPAQSIDRVVGYARSSGITRFAGLVPAGVYGQRASTSFLRAVEQAGGQVVSLQTYDRGQGQVAAAVTRLSRTSPYEAVLIADQAGTAAVAVPAIRRGTSKGARVLGTELWNTETGLGSMPALNGAWYASVSNALYRQFATKYRARFNAAPYRLSSLGYDSVLLTIRIARDWPIGRDFPESRLRGEDGFAGLDGAFRFGRDGVAERALEVQEVRTGGAVTVSPAPRTFGE
ncbi:ABC transporter substrate-binding protein [Sphingomonas sp. Leaf407]|uniref:penicillin-binding protein activator n=1 Tax=unclassified Sphingomonas TaxID=196159 RepID=UPI0006FD0ED6|nr:MULTISPECIES: penicillin-binding protein activator [unclassified Sphingomonas]KQN39585.1 ABC transporter substrate-binding protein [Sphingomonas sp. Leaf42]KQT28862.1 ABC transporter substrate-binding protein [Sphingomonas sp. Leaf407]